MTSVGNDFQKGSQRLITPGVTMSPLNSFGLLYNAVGVDLVTNVRWLLPSSRVTKPLPTFTNVVDDWHPEKAAHRGPCNLCHQKDQRRTMVLDR